MVIQQQPNQFLQQEMDRSELVEALKLWSCRGASTGTVMVAVDGNKELSAVGIPDEDKENSTATITTSATAATSATLSTSATLTTATTTPVMIQVLRALLHLDCITKLQDNLAEPMHVVLLMDMPRDPLALYRFVFGDVMAREKQGAPRMELLLTALEKLQSDFFPSWSDTSRPFSLHWLYPDASDETSIGEEHPNLDAICRAFWAGKCFPVPLTLVAKRPEYVFQWRTACLEVVDKSECKGIKMELMDGKSFTMRLYRPERYEH